MGEAAHCGAGGCILRAIDESRLGTGGGVGDFFSICGEGEVGGSAGVVGFTRGGLAATLGVTGGFAASVNILAFSITLGDAHVFSSLGGGGTDRS